MFRDANISVAEGLAARDDDDKVFQVAVNEDAALASGKILNRETTLSDWEQITFGKTGRTAFSVAVR